MHPATPKPLTIVENTFENCIFLLNELKAEFLHCDEDELDAHFIAISHQMIHLDARIRQYRRADA